MGFQDVKKKLHYHEAQAADVGAKKTAVWAGAGGMLTPPSSLPPLRPLKVVGRRRHAEEEKQEEEVTTPRGHGCRIPAVAATCPPAPKKARTASAVAFRRCNCDVDGDALEFFRVPADLEAVFVSIAAKAN